MNLWNALEKAKLDHPTRPAIQDGGEVRSWDEVHRRASARAVGLTRVGVEAGDRIAVLEWNSAAFLELTFAVARVGAVLVPINWRLDGRQVRRVLEKAGARMLVANASFEELVREALDADSRRLEWVAWVAAKGSPSTTGETAWEDLVDGATAMPEAAEHPYVQDAWSEELAHLYFTSGTTGEPKGVMLTHRNIGVHAEAAIAELEICESDVWVHVAPMFHLADAWATVAITLAGGCHVFVPRFDAEELARTIGTERVTLTNLIPTMLAALVEHVRLYPEGFDPSSLRMMLSGGAPIAPDLVRRIVEALDCEYVQTYGMTETSPYLTLSLLDAGLRRESDEIQFHYRAKTGRPFRGVELRLVDDEGKPVAADGKSVGEIQARGATVTSGYWNAPDATAAAFDGDWLRTGDLATLDERGYYDIVDRKKDVIITGGENVYSTEVENVLYEHPSVLEAAVVGRLDERWGERVHAVVVLTSGARTTADELLAHCRAMLPGFKSPKTLELRDGLPKTGSGKIQKRALR